MTQLNEKQTSSLFDFVRSKYVRYVDVQHELVDHLASDIEMEMEADAAISFDEALKKVYAKFPISGFSKYVSESEKAMNRMWMKNILSQFTPYNGIPFLMTLAALILIQYQLIVFFGTPIFYTLIILALLFGYGSIWRFRTVIKGDEKKVDDKYLVVIIFKSWAMMFSFGPVILSQFLSDFKWVHRITEDMTLQIFAFSLILSLSFIWSAMTYYRFPELISSVLKDKYAHLKLSV